MQEPVRVVPGLRVDAHVSLKSYMRTRHSWCLWKLGIVGARFTVGGRSQVGEHELVGLIFVNYHSARN